MVLAWDNLQKIFVILVLVVVLLHGRFFIHCFLTSSFILPWAIAKFIHSEIYSQYFHLNFSGLFRHIFTASATVLKRRFLLTGVFYLALLPHILARFCHSDAGRNTPSRILLTKLFLPLTTHFVDTRPLVYQLRQWATKYRVTKLLDMFQPTYGCSKLYGKTIKTLWTRLVNKYWLKLLQRNCFLSIHQS